MRKYVAAIDQGTTGTRCILFDHAGLPVAMEHREHRQIYPGPGMVEHDPMEIWENTRATVAGTLRKAGARPAEMVAVGVANQRETTVVWDRATGRPFHHALVWQDTRTDGLCRELAAEGGPDRFRDRTGLPLATYFSGPKIRWLLDRVEGLRDAAERGNAIFGTMDSWIVWNLTGGPSGGTHVTDVTNASRTLLMNLDTLDWNEEIAAIMRVPLRMLPAIRPSSDPGFYGYTTDTGPFGGRIPVCGDLGDQQAATVGQTCFDPGEAKNTYGTGCFLLLNTGTDIVPSAGGLLTTVCYRFGDEPAAYALEGSVAMAGAVVQWLRDNLKLIDRSSDVEALAATVEDNGDVYFVPAFSGLFAPYWRNDARGVIVGLTRYAHRGHLARAALEATAYQTREVLDAMRADSGVDLTALKVDGGMVRNDLLMQFQADVLNVPVLRPKVSETTALGAAYAAGLAAGFWRNTDELRGHWDLDKTWLPSTDDTARTVHYMKWKKAVTRTFGWV